MQAQANPYAPTPNRVKTVDLGEDYNQTDYKDLGYSALKVLGVTGMILGGTAAVALGMSGNSSSSLGALVMLGSFSIMGLSGYLFVLAKNGQAQHRLQRRIKAKEKDTVKRSKVLKIHQEKYDKKIGSIYLSLALLISLFSIPEFIDGNCCAEDLPLIGLAAVPAALSVYYFTRSNSQRQAYFMPSINSDRYTLNLGFSF